jgi:hypothetical protein
MKRWAKKSKWKTFLRTGSIDDDVASSTSDIDRVVEKLQASPCGIPRFTTTDGRHVLSYYSMPKPEGVPQKWWNTCKLSSSLPTSEGVSSLGT